MNIKLYYIILILLCLTIISFGQNISFQKEILNIYVNDSSCILEGKYFLRNNKDNKQRYPIYYPIAVNEVQYYPGYIEIQGYQQNAISYNRKDDGVRFSVNIPGDTTIAANIEYRQKVSNNKFEYILKSTQSWGEPLKYAIINIHVPKTMRLTNTNFNYNRVENRENKLIYVIKRENFFPEKNLKIDWQERQ